jgi:hypothetical protein
MQELSIVNWAALEGIGPALAKMAGGLSLFALAGLVFLNPVMLLGMMMMVNVLSSVASVLIPLSEALSVGGDGMDKMASGVMRLSDSLEKLDLEKLEKVKEISNAMAAAAAAGGAMDAISKLVETINKSNSKEQEGGKGNSRPIIIQLKMPNGRIIEEHIIKDIDKVS